LRLSEGITQFYQLALFVLTENNRFQTLLVCRHTNADLGLRWSEFFTMRTTRHILGRTLVWLAVVAIPLESLPAAACGCTSSVACSAPAGCCCTGAKVCKCGATSASCCSRGASETGCSCGDNCQCSQNSTPAKPVVPPVESSSSERILADSTAAAFLATVCLPSSTRQHLDLHAGANALTALDCCVILCRFTL